MSRAGSAKPTRFPIRLFRTEFGTSATDEGGQHVPAIYTLITSAKLNDAVLWRKRHRLVRMIRGVIHYHFIPRLPPLG
jgi:hypothetical protein